MSTNDPTGVRRLVAAGENALHWLSIYLPEAPGIGAELKTALAAVRVAELERVVEAARGCVYQTDTRGPKVQMCIDRMRQALAALDAGAKEAP